MRAYVGGSNPFIGDVVAEALAWAELTDSVRLADRERADVIDYFGSVLPCNQKIGVPDIAWSETATGPGYDILTGMYGDDPAGFPVDMKSGTAPNN